MNEKHGGVTRRDFVRGTVGTALAASLATTGVAEAAPAQRSSHVVLVRDAKVLADSRTVDNKRLRKMLTDALIHLTGKTSLKESWLSLIKPSDRVGLVATSHLNATHVEVVRLVRETLVEAGVPADQIRDAQGSADNAKACTALVALPALKAHWLTGIGTVLKNYIMFSGSPSSYHRSDSVKLGEIWQMPHVKGKTRLILVDAMRPLCDKGPQPDPRYLWDYQGLIAGTDPVAIDTVAVKILEAKRQELHGEPWPLSPPPLCVTAADEKYGLGTSKWDEIRLEKLGWGEQTLV